MQCSPQELKEKLLRHLDNDCNVLDLQGVLEVMPVLERYPITKEHLEILMKLVFWKSIRPFVNLNNAYAVDINYINQTRLGRYVNEMRRKTADRSLARRAKELVRNWQQLVANQSSCASSSVEQCGATSAEIHRVQSSGSLTNSSGHIQATNGLRQPPNRSTNGSYSRTWADDASTTAEELLSGSSASSVPRSRYQPSSGVTVHSTKQSFSRACSQPSTPVTAAATFNSLSRPATPVTVSFRTQTPTSQITAAASAPKLKTAGVSPLAATSARQSASPSPSQCVANGTGSLPPDTLVSSSKIKQSGSTGTLLDDKRKHANGRNGMKYTASANNLSCNGMWSVHNDTNSGTAYGVTSSPDLQRTDAPLGKLKIKINRTSASGSVSSPVADLSPATVPAKKTQKVATTAELIQRLHANGELRLVASDTLNRIATNQIEHEIDDSNVSIVPEGAKPRPHKKRRIDKLPNQVPPAMTDRDLLEVKAERVRSFVQMSAGASAGALPTLADSDLLGLICHLPPPASDSVAPGAVKLRESEPPTVDASSVELQLPSLEDFEIDWDSNAYTVPSVRPPPTDADVDRLLGEQWPSVNGQYDHRGEWTDWTQSYSAQSYDSSLIHILPYIDIDD